MTVRLRLKCNIYLMCSLNVKALKAAVVIRPFGIFCQKKPKKHGSQKFPEIIAVELLLSYVAQVG